MNKESFVIILQAALFNFDGATEEEIKRLNSNYDLNLIRTGIRLTEYLKGLKQ